MRTALVLLIAACNPQPPDLPQTGDPPVLPGITGEALPIEEQASRISMALLGRRPTADELDLVLTDPSKLESLVDRWVADPALGTMVRELYSEVLLTRSFELNLPAFGPLAGLDRQTRTVAVGEEPLAFIARVVTDGRPFTDIVTAKQTVLDATGAKMWAGHDYNPNGADEQLVNWIDDRPAAGILTSNGLWTRHPSAGRNYHRGRANVIANALLCEDFLERDVPISSDIDLSDDDAIAQAVNSRPECVSCHQALDPLAAHLWPFLPEVSVGSVGLSYLFGCVPPLDQCYPIDTWRSELALATLVLQLRPPGFFGQPTRHIGNLGKFIAEDPRFARCATKRFYGYLTQTPVDAVPDDVTAALQQRFVAGGYDARQLARDVVMHPQFLTLRDDQDPDADAKLAGPQLARPWQLHHLIADLTGFTWEIHVDGLLCDLGSFDCYGDIEMMNDDVHGLRAMTGGVDGARITHPTHSPTPIKLLALTAHAEEAAGFMVPRDLDEPDRSQRRLLRQVDDDTTDAQTVRLQLASLHQRILVQTVEPDGAEVDGTWALWRATWDRTGDAREAWRVVISAMLRAPRVLYY